MMENFSIKKASNADERILKISAAMDEFEDYTQQRHGAQIAELCDALAQKFNLAAHDRLVLRQAALVHDIGEVLMNREYIKSERIMTSDERLDMQRHPVIGEQEAAKLGLSRAVQLLVRWHHEWWNGSGYPDALQREQIPLGARILRAADSFAALTSKRPFRAASSKAEAKHHLSEWAGIEFDPKVIQTLLALEYPAETETEFETEREEPAFTFLSNFAN